MKQILVLSLFLYKSMLKQKSTTLFVLISLGLLVITYFISDVNIASRFKLFEDVLLSSQMLMLHMAAFFYAYDYLQKERIGGIFILPFSTGIKRPIYFLGTWFSLVAIVMLLTVVFLLIDIIFLFFVESTIEMILVWQIILYMFSSIILLSLVLMFSQFVSMMNAMIYSAIVFMIGTSLDEIYYYAYIISEDVVVQKIVSILYYALPNFSYFDYQTKVVNRVELDLASFYIEPIVYFSVIVSMILSIAYFKFSRRVLKVGE